MKNSLLERVLTDEQEYIIRLINEAIEKDWGLITFEPNKCVTPGDIKDALNTITFAKRKQLVRIYIAELAKRLKEKFPTFKVDCPIQENMDNVKWTIDWRDQI